MIGPSEIGAEVSIVGVFLRLLVQTTVVMAFAIGLARFFERDVALVLTIAAAILAGGATSGVASEDAGSPARRSEKATSETSPEGMASGSASRIPERTTEEEQLHRIRAMIYVLRHHRVFERVDVWAGAIAELTAMGDLALPELIRELDDTDRDATLRALGFTLRAIGDPRAVPALIRAIPKTLRPPGSDCGMSASDPELLRFMILHQRSGSSDDRFSYGRPVNEILSALERLTGHQYPEPAAGRDPLRHVFLARPGQPADPAREAAKRERFEERMNHWQSWWDEHRHEFATDEELEAVELPPRSGAPITEAGIAEFGPMFPTGPDVQLSPVRDVVLESLTLYNAPAYVDFDSDRVFEFLEDVNSLSDEELSKARSRETSWKWAMGIDARCLGTIEGQDLHVWQIDNARWDSIDKEVADPGPLTLGPEARSWLKTGSDGTTATYLFTTREGGAGILQVDAWNAEEGTSRMRYRMMRRGRVPDTEETPSTARPATTPLTTKGSVTIRKAAPLFSFRTMSEFSIPEGIVLQNGDPIQTFEKDATFAAWCRRWSVDLALRKVHFEEEAVAGFGSGGAPRTPPPAIKVALHWLDATAVRVLPRSFDTLTAETVAELIERMGPQPVPASLWPTTTAAHRPDTFAIRTRDGRYAVIQLAGPGSDPDSVVVRYRLEAR